MFICPNCKRFQDDSPAFIHTDKTLETLKPIDCRVICCSCGYNKYILQGYIDYRIKGRFEDKKDDNIPSVISNLMYNGGKPMKR